MPSLLLKMDRGLSTAGHLVHHVNSLLQRNLLGTERLEAALTTFSASFKGNMGQHAMDYFSWDIDSHEKRYQCETTNGPSLARNKRGVDCTR
jgi:hypothetical protein